MTVSSVNGKVLKAAEVFIYIFAAECVCGGGGRWLCIGNISIRMILFTVCFVLSLPFVIAKRKELLRSRQLMLTSIFGVYVLISAIIGYFNGNNISFIWADITSFLTLALLPGIIAVIDDRTKLDRLLNVVFYSSVAVAVVTICLHLILAWTGDIGINAINDWINEKGLGGLAMLETRLQRVYFKSQIFLQFSAIIAVWKIWNINGTRRIVFFLCEGLILIADILSYTRGFWLGLGVSAIAIFAFDWQRIKPMLVTAGTVLVCMGVFCGVSALCYGQPYAIIEVVNRFDADLIVLSAPEIEEEDVIAIMDNVIEDESGIQAEEAESAETEIIEAEPVTPEPEEVEEVTTIAEEIDIVVAANEAAVNLRVNSLSMLNYLIKQHPIIGNGLGTNLDGVRDDGKTEYMYQDIMMKMGLIGLVLFLLVFLLIPVRQLINRFLHIRQKQDISSADTLSCYLACAYLGVAVTSILNPFLTSPMGILMLFIIVINERLCASDEKGGQL